MVTVTPWKFWTNDERLAWEYLSGRIVDGPDGWSHQYFDPGSPQEIEARAALVRVLKGQERNGALIKDQILGRLASLFNPTGGTMETRELVFGNRGPGTQPEHIRDMEIAEEVARKVADGIKVEAAIQEAMVRFKVTRPTAFRAWKAHGDSFVLKRYVEGRFRGALPKRVRTYLESLDPDSLK